MRIQSPTRPPHDPGIEVPNQGGDDDRVGRGGGGSAYRFLASAELDVVAAAGLEVMVRRRRRGAEAGAERGEEYGLGHGGRPEEMGRQAKAAGRGVGRATRSQKNYSQKL